LHQRGDHRVLEGVVVLREVVDRRRRQRGAPLRQRPAQAEAAGPELERDLGEDRVDQRVLDPERVRRVVPDRRNRQGERGRRRPGSDRRRLHLAGGRPGGNSVTAGEREQRLPRGSAHARGGDEGGERIRVEEMQLERRLRRRARRLEVDEHEVDAVERAEVLRAVVACFLVDDRGHQPPLLWNVIWRGSSMPATR
jgi:hypothetical protein